MTDTTDKKVFLCHSSDDKAAIRVLYGKLVNDGVSPWLDEEDLLPGQEWKVTIADAVVSSAIVLVCLSKASVTKTGFVNKEIKYALDRADEQPEGKIYIIPVRLEPCEVPRRLQRWQWVDLFDAKGYSKLLTAISTTISNINNQDSPIKVTGEMSFVLSDKDPDAYGIKVILKDGSDLDLGWHEVTVELTVTNVGSESLQIVSAYIDKESSIFQVVPPSLPMRLVPCTQEKFNLQPEYFWGPTVEVGVLDARGNAYSVNINELDKIMDAVDELPIRVREYRHEVTGEVMPMAYMHRRDNFKLVPKEIRSDRSTT